MRSKAQDAAGSFVLPDLRGSAGMMVDAFISGITEAVESRNYKKLEALHDQIRVLGKMTESDGQGENFNGTQRNELHLALNKYWQATSTDPKDTHFGLYMKRTAGVVPYTLFDGYVTTIGAMDAGQPGDIKYGELVIGLGPKDSEIDGEIRFSDYSVGYVVLPNQSMSIGLLFEYSDTWFLYRQSKTHHTAWLATVNGYVTGKNTKGDKTGRYIIGTFADAGSDLMTAHHFDYQDELHATLRTAYKQAIASGQCANAYWSVNRNMWIKGAPKDLTW